MTDKELPLDHVRSLIKYMRNENKCPYCNRQLIDDIGNLEMATHIEFCVNSLEFEINQS